MMLMKAVIKKIFSFKRCFNLEIFLCFLSDPINLVLISSLWKICPRGQSRFYIFSKKKDLEKLIFCEVFLLLPQQMICACLKVSTKERLLSVTLKANEGKPSQSSPRLKEQKMVAKKG